jgi:phosphatidate phosphatase APP1
MLTLQATRMEIESHQTVMVYPTFAHYDTSERTWQVSVRGSVHELGPNTLRRRLLLKILQKAMRAEPEDMQSEIFKRRVQGFLQLSEKGKQITVRLGARLHILKKKSKRNGHFFGQLCLSDAEIDDLRDADHIRGNWLHFDVITRNGEMRSFPGRVRLVPPTGLSVISDVDDTIKHSNVGRRADMLANTFLRDHQSIPGMSDLYRQWHSEDAVFHYVSSSPWQLFDCLVELCSEHGFPEGTFHLRSIRLRDPTVLRLFIARRWGKRRMIDAILKTFPQRRFLLVGDSGEKDPEIYGAMARKYPDRVERILIRNVSQRCLDADRLVKAFRDVPARRWCVFDDPREVADVASGGP